MTENPAILKQKNSHAQMLKSRLDWGEPALTIIDVRDRENYYQSHITGALPMSLDNLKSAATKTLARSRNIYVYGFNDAHTLQAVQALRSQGFENVSELKGGLAAWKAVGGATEGIV